MDGEERLIRPASETVPEAEHALSSSPTLDERPEDEDDLDEDGEDSDGDMASSHPGLPDATPSGARLDTTSDAPAAVRTGLARRWRETPEARSPRDDPCPAGRVRGPRDVVGSAPFCCSPASDFVSGQVRYVDGGIAASQ